MVQTDYIHIYSRGGVTSPAGPALTTFQRVVGLVLRLERQSEDQTIGPSVPRKLPFPLRVCISCNRSRLLLVDQEPSVAQPLSQKWVTPHFNDPQSNIPRNE